MMLHLHMSHLENEIMKNRMTLFSICIALLLPPFLTVQAENLPPQNSAETQEQTPEHNVAEEIATETSSESGIDLQETLVHAAARMNGNEGPHRMPARGRREAAGGYTLSSRGRVAQIPPLSGGEAEYISMFFIDGRPAYCIEPEVAVFLSGGRGPSYTADRWSALRPEDTEKLKRIAWFGYGHPMTGTSPAAYIATQMLIWEIVSPHYEQINQNIQLCGEPSQGSPVCTAGRGNLDELMASIRDLTQRYDTVPSFADSWHGVREYEIGWDETLCLEDENHVLDWFRPDSRESHAGIQIKVEGSRLLADIDSLYYDAPGKTLTFERDPEQWNNMLNGVLLYSSGASQRLLGADSQDPTPQFQLAFRLKTADIELTKLDEYGIANNHTAGTEYAAGWCEDPELQYESTAGGGLGDPHWTDFHDAARRRKDDRDGLSNEENGIRLYYPVWKEDGSGIRTWKIGADGKLNISGFLPAERTWWLREVKASDPYELDSRVFSLKTGAPGTTAEHSFVNGLRDITLEILKQDEEEQAHKINGAGYRIYELDEHPDWTRKTTPYGIEASLNRLQKPSLSYAQLKKNTTLQSGDRFQSGGWTFEIESEQEKSWIVRAMRPAEEQKEDRRIFSRYQLPDSFSTGTAVDTADVLRLHASRDPSGWDSVVHHARVSGIDADAHTVTLCGSDLKENVRISADSSPSLEQFYAAAAENGAVLQPGTEIPLEGRRYTVKLQNEDSLIVSPQRMHVIDLNDGAPVYADLPDPLNLKENDVFELDYPKHPTGHETASFQVLESTPDYLKLGMNPQKNGYEEQFVVPRPEWISYEDIPEETERRQRLRVERVTLPVYEVADSRGVRYRVCTGGTEVLGADGEYPEGSRLDITYAEIRGAQNAAQPGGACLEPFDPQGCPVGIERRKQIPETEAVPYQGVQYEDLSEEEHGLETGGNFQRDAILYTVLEPDDGDTVRLSCLLNGEECMVELAAGKPADKAFHTVWKEVVFRVTDRRLREFDLCWDTLNVPKNSLSRERRFHLCPFSEEETQGDLSWQTLPDPAMAAGGRFTDANGMEYTVLYQDAVNRRMVLQSKRGRYELTPESVRSVLPLSYADLVEQEAESGKELMPGDSLTGLCPEQVENGESFLIRDLPCTMLSRELETDRDSETLTDPQGKHRRTIAAPWQPGAPFSYAQILEKKDEADKISVGEAAYIWHPAEASGDGLGTLLEDPAEAGCRSWTYYRLDTEDRENHNPYERQEPVLKLEVPKPENLVWADLETVMSAPKKTGDWFRIRGQRYQIIQLEENTMHIQSGKKKEKMVLKRETQAEETEAPEVTYEEAAAAPRDLESGDRFSLGGKNYLVLNRKDTAYHGRCFKLRCLDPKKEFEVLEIPEADAYEPESVDFFPPGVSCDLTERYPQATGFRLRAENPHIRLETGKQAGTVHTCMKADGPAAAELLLLNADGLAMDCRWIVISRQQEGTVTGLPIFAGVSGRQYVRLTDRKNHNRPLPFHAVSFCRDENLRSPVRSAVSASTGEIDVSDMAPGKYWYRDPLDHETVHSFAVAEPADAEGMLKVDGLKWGRTYMACEFDLPEGYDYGRNEVCTMIAAAAQPGETRITAELENRLRRLQLQVLKVDQEDHSTPLNGAWFTVRDIENAAGGNMARKRSEDAARIRLEDIPPDAEAGDLVPVLRAGRNSPAVRYRIEQVEDSQIVIEEFAGNRAGRRHYVPRKGFSRTSPVLYSDIVRAAGKLKPGEVFEVRRKQDHSLARMYRILTLEKEPGRDLFGKPCGRQTIAAAVVQDQQDAGHRVIRLQNALDSGANPGELLGHFVSGAILTQETEVTDAVPRLPDGLNPDALKPADQFTADVRKVIRMPSYAEVQALHPEPGNGFEFAGQVWELAEQSADRLVLRFQNREVILHSYTQPGALAVTQKRGMTVKEIAGDHTVLCTDEAGNSWCLQAQPEKAAIGQPGVYVAVARDEEMKDIILDGYTDGSGQLLFDKLPEGRYWVERGGIREETVVEKGMIHLPAVKYGHAVEVCETRSPLGYIIGNACEVVHPKAEYSVDTVRNRRANKAVRHIRRIIRIRRMGNAS
jgi:hypothetical protein